jgi:pimeloyl-ACP methyl ester carboxylesterase
MRRGLKVLIAVLAALLVLLVLNAVVLDRQTKSAEVTVDGGEILRLPGGDVQVLDKGPRDAPPIVLLHCYTCAIDWWDELIPLLERDHRVIAIDLLGHGGSDKPRSGYSMQNQADLVAQALGELGVTNATVVGHSLGGAVATALAEQSKDLVGGVVIVDTEPDTSYGKLGLLARATLAPVIGEALWRTKMDWSIRDGLKEAFAPGYDVPDAFVEDVKRMTYSAYDDSSSGFDSYVGESPLDERLRALRIPLLVIFGAEEQIVNDPREALSAYADIPGAETELIAGAGHSPNVEKPAETARLILRFARTVPSTTVTPDPGRAAAPRKIVARCDQAIIGPGRRNWRKHSVVAGRFGLSRADRGFPTAVRVGEALIVKLFALVEGQREVTLKVPRSERGRVGFFYGPVRSVKSVAEAPWQVTFKPCSDKPRTAFPGGLALTERRPVALEVISAGSVKRIRVG